MKSRNLYMVSEPSTGKVGLLGGTTSAMAGTVLALPSLQSAAGENSSRSRTRTRNDDGSSE
jgi:hypothetical protein